MPRNRFYHEGRDGSDVNDKPRFDPSSENHAPPIYNHFRNGIQETFEMENLSKSSDYISDEESEKEILGMVRGDESSLIESSLTLYTPDEESCVIKTFDRRLVLFVALLYMLSFLDRSNIGNAKIAGLSEDLRLSSSQYEWLLGAFYITYILFEWMTLLYRVVPARIYIAICVFSWGFIASLQSIVSSFASLVILRALLGISEAAFGPGIPFYLSFFYKRDELAFRIGLFISAAPLATSFASSLAWLITKSAAKIPIAAWRMLFLVEGFPSIIVAVFVWYQIPDSPGTARYLSQRLQQVATLRLQKEEDDEEIGEKKDGSKLREIWNTLKDPKCYLAAGMFFCCNVAFSSLPVFLPTIIKEMGHSALTSQALSAPPYLAAFIVVLLTAYLSDHFRIRGSFVIFHSLLAAFGYALLAIAGAKKASPTWRYVGIFPSTSGFFSAITIIITWTINNQDSGIKKGTGVAILNFIGQLGPLVGIRLYPASDGPYYVRGMSICAGFLATVCILAMLLSRLLAAKNRETAHYYSSIENEDEGLVDGARGSTRTDRFAFML